MIVISNQSDAACHLIFFIGQEKIHPGMEEKRILLPVEKGLLKEMGLRNITWITPVQNVGKLNEFPELLFGLYFNDFNHSLINYLFFKWFAVTFEFLQPTRRDKPSFIQHGIGTSITLISYSIYKSGWNDVTEQLYC